MGQPLKEGLLGVEPRWQKLWWLGLLTAAVLHAQETQFRPPLTPREFHDRECARLRHTLSDMETRPLLSTQSDYDAVYYDLTFDVRDFAGHTISGKAVVVVRSRANDLNELILDLCSSLTVDSVIGAGPRPFTLNNSLLTVTLDRTYVTGELVQVTVYYHGQPCTTAPNTTFTFYNRPAPFHNIPTLYTVSEPYGARDWWPCKNVPGDKADSVRVSIIVADTLTATSNGVLESVTAIPPSSRRFTWAEHYPIAPYLVSIAATNYAHYTDWYVSQSGDSVPIEHYPYPELLTQAQVSWSPLPAMMAFDAQLFGEYPFAAEKYGHTMWSYAWTAMEHQCNTSYYSGLTDGHHTYDYIVQHELAHQWWGDNVTLATWPDIWLNEGFASYAEALWVEHVSGFAAYRNYLFASAGLRVTDPSGPVYNPAELFDGNTVYNKGAWILHMLRGVLRNDSLFFAALREYRTRHAYGNATTADFLSDMSDAVGYDVTPYLYTFLYRTNRPVYDVSFGSAWRDSAYQTVVRIRQSQINPDTTFTTRLDLRFKNGTDSLTVRVENDTWRERYYFSVPFSAAQLTVDPDDWVLKQVFTEELPLTVLSSSLPDGRVGEAYRDTLISIGGGGDTLGWNLLSEEVPGMLLSGEGVLAGTPSEGGEFALTVRVENELGQADTLDLSLHIAGALSPPCRLTACWVVDQQVLALRWSAVAEADSYHVYRARRFDMQDMERFRVTADTVVFDSIASSTNPDSLVARFYQVIAVNDEEP
jgi:aminopeptidase N